MKKLLSVFAFGSLMFANPNNINLQITNSTIAAYLESGLNQEQLKLRGMFIYNDNSDKHNFYSAGIKAEGNLIGSNNTSTKFSIITDFVHTKNNSAIALGCGIFSFIPQINLPVFIRAEGEYAPKVLSFDDAERFSRVSMDIGYMPIENGEVFVGYRNISFDNNYNSSLYFGLGYSF